MIHTRETVLPLIRQALTKHPVLPSVLYRFDEKREFGDSILSGSVWVSTLKHCRETEDAVRGDPGDGSMLYNSGTVRGDSDDPVVSQILARMPPIQIRGTDVRISNVTLDSTIPDAFVYCTTLRHDPQAMREFGESCIRIRNPTEFFHQMTAALILEGARYTLPDRQVGFETMNAKEITYADRIYVGLEDAPGAPGFVKPRDKYAKEQEFRMLWYPLTWPAAIQPHLLKNAIDPSLVERVN